MNSSSAHTLVLGLGESGEAAAELSLSEGCATTVLDGEQSELTAQRAARLEQLGARVRFGAGPLPQDRFVVCVVSPGVPSTHPWLAEAAHRRLEIVSELEWGWRRATSPVVAVTGSNGKSTAVKWLTDIFAACGQRAVAAGNYGTPVSRAVRALKPGDWLVLEVSSFQLETTRDFRADVGVLLNVHPNHLDRHGSMEEYLGLKSRLFAAARSGDVCIVPSHLLGRIQSLAGDTGEWVTFGTGEQGAYGYGPGGIRTPYGALLSLAGTPFDNEVYGLNAAAVMAAVDACGLSRPRALEAATAFQTLPHRLELVGIAAGTRFVDDSKSTNLAALVAAVRMVPPPVRLIAGGLAKESAFSEAKEFLAQKAVSVYLIGHAAEAMYAAWHDAVNCRLCVTLEAAVAAARQDARPGDTVLLAPGCASFDQFKNYAERGERFKALIAPYIKEEKACAGKEQHTTSSN